MAALFQWFRSRIPGRSIGPIPNDRLQSFARSVEQELVTKCGGFQYHRCARALGLRSTEIGPVAERVYELALERTWRDSQITPKERVALDAIARALNLDATRQRRVEDAVGREVFIKCASAAVQAGQLDEKHFARLEVVARSLGTSVRELVRQYFHGEAAAFVRSMFAAVVSEGSLDDTKLGAILNASEALGFASSEALSFVQPQAERLVEHVLADAKSDGEISSRERKQLEWLIERLKLDPAVELYVEDQMFKIDALRELRLGRLPTLPPPAELTLRAGEILHFCDDITYETVRIVGDDSRIERQLGALFITDSRLLFSADMRSFDIPHGRVLGIVPHANGFEVRSSAKGSGFYVVDNDVAAVVSLIYRTAVDKANQTVVQAGTVQPPRYIPRDVRQRVWQKYGGVCVQCGASQYLEFDHIIPVARGGASTDANVQLLCRNCNSAKSDKI